MIHIFLITMIQDLNIYDTINLWIKILLVDLAAFTLWVSVLRDKFFLQTNLKSLECCHKCLTLVLLLAGTFANYPILTIFVIALCVFICAYTFKLIYLCKFFTHNAFAHTHERTHARTHACNHIFFYLY